MAKIQPECLLCGFRQDEKELRKSGNQCPQCFCIGFPLQYRECACGHQIIWFFEKPTIIACEKCEVTFYHNVKECPYCGKKTTEFVKKEEE